MSTSSTVETIIGLTPAAVEQVRAMQYGLVFDEQRAGDLVTEQGGVTALVDAFSAEYLRGSVVDFSDALTGGGFKLTNPKAKHSCGCGKSFET
jgi:iron-sulfur cluster assembly accessory protein